MKICTILRPGVEAIELAKIVKQDFEQDAMDKMPQFGEHDDPAKMEAA